MTCIISDPENDLLLLHHDLLLPEGLENRVRPVKTTEHVDCDDSLPKREGAMLLLSASPLVAVPANSRSTRPVTSWAREDCL